MLHDNDVGLDQHICLKCGRCVGCSSNVVALTCNNCKIKEMCEFRLMRYPDAIEVYCSDCLRAVTHPKNFLGASRDIW
jgi:hypothetical protein